MKRFWLTVLALSLLAGWGPAPAAAARKKPKEDPGTLSASERYFAGRYEELANEMEKWLKDLTKRASILKTGGALRDRSKAFWRTTEHPSEKLRTLVTMGKQEIKSARAKHPTAVALEAGFRDVMRPLEKATEQTWRDSPRQGTSLEAAVQNIRSGYKDFNVARGKADQHASKLMGIITRARRKYEDDNFPVVPNRKPPNTRRIEWTQEEKEYGEKAETYFDGVTRHTDLIYRCLRMLDTGKMVEGEFLSRVCKPAAALNDPDVYTFTERPPTGRMRPVHETLLEFVRKAKEAGDLLPKDKVVLAVDGHKLNREKLDKACDDFERARRAFLAGLYTLE